MIERRTALITGAAKRLGRAIALALADRGADIIIHYRDSEDEAIDLAGELETRGARSWMVKADFENPEDYESLIERAISAAGPFDILVNNASIFPVDRMDDVTFTSFETNMKVNAWAPFAISRSFARQIGQGSIVNLIDSRVSSYDWTHVAYIWSKHVLAAMTSMLALHLAPDIRVNAVSPGLILPPPGKDQSYIDRLVHTVPLKRHGDAEDVAEAVAFLAYGTFITGEVIFVDGGRHLKEYNSG